MDEADRKAFEDWFHREYVEPYQMEKDAAKDAWQAALERRDKQVGKPAEQVNQQMIVEVLNAVETVLADAYHRHFAECCGKGQGVCCGNFIEQWTQEDHKILDTLSPIQRKLQSAILHAKGELA